MANSIPPLSEHEALARVQVLARLEQEFRRDGSLTESQGTPIEDISDMLRELVLAQLEQQQEPDLVSARGW